MFKPKYMIPGLAAGAISLAGCANVNEGDPFGSGGTTGTGGVSGTGGTTATGGTSGTGGSGRTFAQSLDAFCLKVVECDYLPPGYVSECVAYYAPLGTLTEPCRSIVQSYLDCVDEGSCENLDDEDCVTQDFTECATP